MLLFFNECFDILKKLFNTTFVINSIKIINIIIQILIMSKIQNNVIQQKKYVFFNRKFYIMIFQTTKHRYFFVIWIWIRCFNQNF